MADVVSPRDPVPAVGAALGPDAPGAIAALSVDLFLSDYTAGPAGLEVVARELETVAGFLRGLAEDGACLDAEVYNDLRSGRPWRIEGV